MGVSGAGKTTLGLALARRLGCAFQDADDLHPPANVDKMRSGRPLTDADRAPWLDRIESWIDAQGARGGDRVLACSALKRRYRDRLRADGRNLILVAIDADKALLSRRLAWREDHFMPDRLLDSQLADYERPSSDEGAIFMDAGEPAERQVDAIVAHSGREGRLGRRTAV